MAAHSDSNSFCGSNIALLSSSDNILCLGSVIVFLCFILCFFFGYFIFCLCVLDRLCGLVVRVLGYRFGGPGSIPGTTRKKK
jgi:hypothetical protein